VLQVLERAAIAQADLDACTAPAGKGRIHRRVE
jgi:hypothetical protein